MKKIISVILLTISCFSSVLSQYSVIRISDISLMANEVTIMINPKNPNQVVAGSNAAIYFNEMSASAFYYSTNGGYNWTGNKLYSDVAIPFGDPVVIVDTAGRFYFIQNSNGTRTPPLDRHLVAISTNGGAFWQYFSTYGKNGDKCQDKPWGCVDWSNSIYRNNIYVSWTEFSHYQGPIPLDSSIILFCRSTNSGDSWTQPIRLSKRKGDARDSCNTLEGAVPCTGPNGEVYVSWSGPINLYTGEYAIFFNKSTNGEITWLDSERVVAMQPGGWNFNIPGLLICNGFPVTCCDISPGPY